MRPTDRRQDCASCFVTGHARVICRCGALVYECRCGVPAAEKALSFAAHPTATTRVDRCPTCRPPKVKGKPLGPDRRRGRRRKALTTPGREFDARQTTRRK